MSTIVSNLAVPSKKLVQPDGSKLKLTLD
jgi:hypothetical protein